MSDLGEFNAYQGGEDSNFVSVKMPGRDLAEFLSKMLGRRRVIQRDLLYHFSLTHDWIVGFIELIDQRITSQNNGQMVSFNAELMYENGKKIIISSYEDFKSFVDISRDISVGCRIDCAYLVKFPSGSDWERQNIILTANTKTVVPSKKKSQERTRIFILPLSSDDNQLQCEIKFTNITFGEDINNLIGNHIASNFQSKSIWPDKIRLIVLPLTPAIFSIIFMIALLNSEITNRQPASDYLKSKMGLFELTPGSLLTIEEKLNILYKVSVLQVVPKPATLLVPIVFGSILFVICMHAILSMKKPSFVIFNKCTELYAKKTMGRRTLWFSVLFLGIFIGCTSGVFGNYIYARLTSMSW